MRMKSLIEGWRKTVPTDVPLPHLWRCVNDLGNNAKEALLAQAEKLGDELFVKCELLREKDRITFVKLMLALLPASHSLIERFVFSKTQNSQEIQFTLWCYLEEVWDDEEMANRHTSFAIDLLRRYLLTDPSDEVLQEWMALDLIFEHLPDHVRLKIIQEVFESKNASEPLKSNLRARMTLRGN